MAVRRVLHALGDQLGPSACFGLAPGTSPVWAEVAAELGLAVGTRGSPAVRVVPLADRVTDNDADRWTLEVISGTEVVAIGTVHPAAAGPGQVGRWPAGWTEIGGW